MNSKNFWEVIERYNLLMNSAIKGPNCVDLCNSDCCSIKIDVPKILAEEYIKRGFAMKNDFIRSDIFSFKLRFDDEKRKCFLYDKKINGCLVHSSGIKPPQCWIYPTNFSNPENLEISCKRTNGWTIIDPEKAKEAEELLKYYIFHCQFEAKFELKDIKERIRKSLLKDDLKSLLKNTPPSQISGFKDIWDSITILPSEGISLQLKKLCRIYNKTCETVTQHFIKCEAICDEVSNGIIDFLQQNLPDYVHKKGADVAGEYLLNDLNFENFICRQNKDS